MLSIKVLQRKRKSLCVIQWFFFSALGCIYPYLSAHMKEIGLTSLESAYLNGLTAMASILGPLLAGPIAHRFNKYQTLIVISLLGSLCAYTSLLFVPRVLRNPRHPSIVFDCTNNNLRMEQCSDWNGQCSIPQRAATGNFTNFTLTKCKYVCPSGASGTMNSSWYPLHVCFISSSEGNLCLVHDPSEADRGLQTTVSGGGGGKSISGKNLPLIDSSSNGGGSAQIDHLIQFDSRFDRWPIIDSGANNDPNIDCAFQTLAPLIVNHRPYESIQCRPYVHHCFIHCKVNILHRPRSSPNSAPRPPAPCYDLVGDPGTTFYSYLIIRSVADTFLFAAFTLIDGLGVTLLSNFDSLYGGKAKVLSMVSPLVLFPTLCGFFVDYYSSLAGQPDYSPPFILFDGLVLITIALVVAIPVPPLPPLLSSSSMVNVGGGKSAHSQSTTSLRSTPSLTRLKRAGSRTLKSRNVHRVPPRNWTILFLFVVPLTILSGALWGALQTFLYPFYLQLGCSKLWIGLSFSFAYLALSPFAYLAKPLISGIGRVHLMALCFVFYALRLSGISVLTQPKWTLLPFEAMEAFTLPLAWLGITSYAHNLISVSSFSARPEPISRSGGTSTSAHLVLHYALHLIHFGLGRVLGAGLCIAWLLHWDITSRAWDWLNYRDLELPEPDPDGYRFFLRLLALGAAAVALPFLFFYHCCGNLVQAAVDCLVGLKDCGSRCKKCCKSACSALCCCSCQFNMCRLCKKSKKRGRKLGGSRVVPSRPSSPTTVSMGSSAGLGGGGRSSENGTGHPGFNSVDYSRLVDHSAASDGYATTKEAGSSAFSDTGGPGGAGGLNGSNSIELLANFQTKPKLANGHGHHHHHNHGHHHHHRIKMIDVVGIDDDESLLSAPR